MRKNRRLLDEYFFTGFHPQKNIVGIFGDPKARVIVLLRRQKKQCAELAFGVHEVFTIIEQGEFEIYLVEMREYFCNLKCVEFFVEGVKK